MKTFAAIVAVLLVAITANAQTTTHIYVPPPASTPAPGYTYYNQIIPSTGQSHTGFVYTQPTSPTTGFQQDMTTGQQSTYTTNGNSTVILPLNPK
jgi:hypothetical protein